MWLTNARYLRPDGTFGHADIEVDGGVVAAITAAGEHPSGVDCAGQVVLPGLVNGHYHSQATLMRGMEFGLEIFDWFDDTPRGRAQQHVADWLDDEANADDVAAVARHEYLTMLRQGVTFVADSGTSDLTPRLLLDAGDAVGVRALPQAYDDRIERVDDPSRYTVHLESEEHLTAEVLAAAQRHRDAYRPIFALHCLETVRRRELVFERWGRSTVEVLAEHGLLSERTVLFHGCEMTADDTAAVAAAGAAIMHCPVSNIGLHGRIPPAVEWYRAGVTLGLGTDWGDTDMWSTVRTAWLLQQREPDRARRARPADVLRMATRGGALGYGRHDLGEVAPGRTADLVFVDRSALGSHVDGPEVSTLASAVLADGGPGVVRHVMVGGDWVLRDGASTRLDEAATADRYRRVHEHLDPA